MEIPDEVLTDAERGELGVFCTTKNNFEFNIVKCLEEMHELGELLTKRLTKAPEVQPDNSKIIEEGGDLIFRFAIVMSHLGIMDEVLRRASNKEAFIYKHLKEKGGTKITIERNT